LSQAKNDLSLWRDRIAVMDRLSGYHNYVSMVEYLSRHCPNLVYLEELKAGPSKEEGSPEMAMPFIPPAASMFTLNTAAQGPLSQQGVPVPPKVSAAESRMDIIYLKGHAADYEALGDLIRVMKSAVYFTNVQLQRSWRPMNLGVDTIAFEIKGNIVPGRPGDGIDYANKQQTKNF
ncbi:MAG: hypothetical protein K9M57_11510, partial [Phycisphaerae bacterium]|nr:hypothetical protein [Phycisphaerae bacterium]